MVQPGGQEGGFDLLLRMPVEQLGAFEFAPASAGGVLHMRVLQQMADGEEDGEYTLSLHDALPIDRKSVV